MLNLKCAIRNPQCAIAPDSTEAAKLCPPCKAFLFIVRGQGSADRKVSPASANLYAPQVQFMMKSIHGKADSCRRQFILPLLRLLRDSFFGEGALITFLPKEGGSRQADGRSSICQHSPQNTSHTKPVAVDDLGDRLNPNRYILDTFLPL